MQLTNRFKESTVNHRVLLSINIYRTSLQYLPMRERGEKGEGHHMTSIEEESKREENESSEIHYIPSLTRIDLSSMPSTTCESLNNHCFRQDFQMLENCKTHFPLFKLHSKSTTIVREEHGTLISHNVSISPPSLLYIPLNNSLPTL